MLVIFCNLYVFENVKYSKMLSKPLSFSCVYHFFNAETVVTAWKDAWIIGDEFVHEIYHALQQMNTESRVAKTSPPYLYDMYNVRCFTANPLSEIKNVATRLVNTLIKALNGSEKLPRIILIAPDWDLIRFINHDGAAAEIIFKEVINWIITNMKCAMESKKDFLLKKKAGAVAEGEPKTIWIKMINRFGNELHTTLSIKALSNKGKFNRVLEDALADQSGHYVMDVNVAVNEGCYFTVDSQLNAAGRIKYWREVNEQVKLFDFRKLSLKPLKKTFEVCRKLPLPDKPESHYLDRYHSSKYKKNFNNNARES